MRRRPIIQVKLEKQGCLPPAQLRRMVGTKWWRRNCHGAKTLVGVEGITYADVSSAQSRIKLNGVMGTLPHTNRNAWIKGVVDKADAGKAVGAGWKQLDLNEFIPDKVREPGTHCALKVVRPEDGVMATCSRSLDHEGECRPRRKRVPVQPNYARR